MTPFFQVGGTRAGEPLLWSKPAVQTGIVPEYLHQSFQPESAVETHCSFIRLYSHIPGFIFIALRDGQPGSAGTSVFVSLS